jgi:hypothetical protein
MFERLPTTALKVLVFQELLTQLEISWEKDELSLEIRQECLSFYFCLTLIAFSR